MSYDPLNEPANQVVNIREKGIKSNEPSGEAESLIGRIRPSQFGDKAVHAKPPESMRQKKPEKKAQTQALNEKKRARVEADKGLNIMNVDITEDLIYRPKTKENRLVYDQLITSINRILEDEPQDVLRGITDEVLACLKLEEKKDTDKKEDIEVMLRKKLSPEVFNMLLEISKQINDYTPEEQNVIGARDEEIEIAVDLDENRRDDDDDEDMKEIEESEDEEEEGEEENKNLALAQKGDGTDFEIEDDQQNIDPNDIDKYWIQRELNKYFPDDIEVQNKADEIINILNAATDIECENRLIDLLGYDKFDLVSLLQKNRHKIYYCTKLKQAQSSTEEIEIKQEMSRTPIGEMILDALEQGKVRKDKEKEFIRAKKEAKKLTSQLQGATQDLEIVFDKLTMTDEAFASISKKALDLESLTFHQGGHHMSNERVALPKGSFKLTKKGYEEVYVPAVKYRGDDKARVRIADLPTWSQPAFEGYRELTRIQSEVFHCAFETPENMLVCAPTGSGKTIIALLTILHRMSLHRKKNGEFDLTKFKVVYIAPMKALVSEIVGNFTKKLGRYGIQIRELTGDMQLTKQQIQETQIIIATPEKWDVITRKAGDRAYLELVKLIIIDEIHLLHDSRGPVLESIVARTIRTIEQTQELVRIVGLSATLPNYSDVAALLRVKAGSGLFHFDNSFRPVPLQQQYIGVTEKKAVRRMILMNEIVYEKVMERAGKFQMLIFVHSRRETIKTAKAIKEMALAKDELGKFVKEDSQSQIILQSEAEKAQNADLKELLPFGFAIHHAGLSRLDRELVEDLFNDRHIQVLVSTATLAWGVNLPAHTVIIKGTQIYSPELGKWVEITPQDVLQMIGRAGRPGKDTEGEGIILTSYQELKFYLSLFNTQLPIESQFISQLADQMNAEVVLGSIMNLRDAVTWLGYTYLYIRMLRAPTTYGISLDEIEDDPLLIKRRTDLAHSAALLLDKHNLIKYDRKSGHFQVTALGKIASHYYIKYPTIATFNEHIKPNTGIIELFKIFSLSNEFKYIPIREEEKIEIQKLMESVPIPIKGSQDEPSTKVNILLQAYISRFKLDGFALNADMVYITQSAGRIMRGLFELFLKRGWAQPAETALNLAKMIDKRMWGCMTPLRQLKFRTEEGQLKSIPEEMLRQIEKKEQLTWEHYYNMSVQQIGELIKFPKFGKPLHRMIHQFPRLELDAYVQPITRNCLKVELTVTPDFQWEPFIHGKSEPFWIFVFDGDNEAILYHEYFTLKHKYIGEKQYVFEFTVPLFEPNHPQYFIKVISDRWVACEAQLPISLRNLLVPEKFPVLTELLDLQLLPITNLKWTEAELLLAKYQQFNPIQTQVFASLYNLDSNVFLGAPTGSGKTLCIIFAMLRCLKAHAGKKIVYVGPYDSVCKQKYEEFSKIFRPLGKKVALFTGQTSTDQKLLEISDIIISSPNHWDVISRRWRQTKAMETMKKLRLFIVDELHLLAENDSVLEVITSRMRYIANQIEEPIRIVGLATSVANSKDIAEWIGASSTNTFNFHPNVRPVPLEIYIQGFDQPQRTIRLLAIGKHIYQGVKQHSRGKPVIIFVSDRKQALHTAVDMVAMAGADNQHRRFANLSEEDLAPYLGKINDVNLKSCVEYGVGFLYEGMNESERNVVEKLFEAGAIQMLVCTYSLCWELTLTAYIVVIMDTLRYNGKERRYVDYSIPDMLQMMGRACRPTIDDNAKCLVYCHTPKKDFYKKFLYEPLPVESSLNHSLNDHLNAEVVTKTIESKQDCIDWITWTFFYRRLTQNPNFYNLQGVTGTIINDYLSELVENTVQELESSKCISVDEDEIGLAPLNLGMISSYYYIKYSTIQLFAESLSAGANFKLKQVLEILCAASEFESIPIRHGEEKFLKQLVTEIKYRLDKAKFNQPNTKTNILLQSHFSRIPLSSDFIYDQKIILEEVVKLIPALVDVISSNGWFKPALIAMQLSQMIVQAMWVDDSPLLQLPHFDDELIRKCKKAGIEDINDLLNMDDDDRVKLLNMSEKQLEDVADVCNKYPNVNMEYQILDEEIFSGETAEIEVSLQREDEDYIDLVYAPYFPKEKEEFVWVVLGDYNKNKLYALKRFRLPASYKVKLNFIAPEEGEHELYLCIYSDSWIGCDQLKKFKINVKPGQEEEDNE